MFMVTGVILIVQLCLINNLAALEKNNETVRAFSADQLLTTVFPKKTSFDVGLNPCKSVFRDDIALPYQEYLQVTSSKNNPDLTKAKHTNAAIRRNNRSIKINPKYEKIRPKRCDENGPQSTFEENPEKLVAVFPEKSSGIHRRVSRSATALSERLWDFGVIPYEIDEKFSGMRKALVKQAMRHWENHTCLKFVERNPNEDKDYIFFTEKPCGCCSFVGKRGIGVQALSIGHKCAKFGIVVHEIGHAIGYYHEHTRPDRDNYVQIHKENILAGQEYNFDKLDSDQINSLGLKYDYDSIMHYARNTYSINNYLDTIEPLEDSGRKTPEIGQRIRLSPGDIAQTNLLYDCPKCGRTFQTNSGIISSPNYNSELSNEEIKCEWRITATHGEKIIVNITDMDIKKSLDCTTDYILVQDGYWQKSPVLGLFCGRGEFRNIASMGSRMLITYFSKNPKGHRGFTANYEAVCGGDLTVDSEGHLESPNYPEDYHGHKDCIWRITVPKNYQVAIRFQSFDIEHHDNCSYDYVEVRDGLSQDSAVLKVFCGQSLPSDLVSSSNQMLVRFVSDGSVQKGGFSAKIIKEYDECAKMDHGCAQKCVNTLGSYACQCAIGFELHSDGKQCVDACGGIFTNPNGTITSPSFPELYPPNKNCLWEISAPKQHIIFLNFTHLDLEGNNYYQQTCEYDRVDVYSKIEGEENVRHGSYCGTKAAGLIISKGNVLRIAFSSDDNIQKSGFAAVYFTDLDECAVNNGGCQHECQNALGSYTCTCRSGYILDKDGKRCVEGDCVHEIFTPPYGTLNSPNYPDYYPPSKECTWHLRTTPGHRIRLAFLYFKLEQHPECFFDNIIIYDGPTVKSSFLGKFCGAMKPSLLTSSENELYMTFKSDENVQRKGFWATHSTVCGGMLQATLNRKEIFSHTTYGNSSYENMMSCDWSIVALSGYNVQVTFLTFDIENENDCAYDFVEIYDGMDSGGASFGKLCGTKKPFNMTSTQEALFLKFRTDDRMVGKGFSLVYEAIELAYSNEDLTQ